MLHTFFKDVSSFRIIQYLQNLINHHHSYKFFALPAIALLSICVVYFPVVSGKFRVSSDGQRAQFSERFVGWSDLYLGGWPNYADPNSMPLYPIKYLFYATENGFTFFALSAFFLFALGNGFLAGHLTKSRLASAFAAAVSPNIGFFVAHFSHTSILHAAAYLPWIMLGSVLLFATSPRQQCGVLLISVSIALSLLAGHPQITIYSILACGLFVVITLFAGLSSFKPLYLWVIAVLLGTAMAAGFLLPTYGFLGETHRATLTTATLSEFSLRAYELGFILFPYIAGGGWWSGVYLPYLAQSASSSWSENISYIGVTIGFLVLIGSRLVFNSIMARALLFVGLISVILAILPSTVFGGFLINIPIVSLFRAWARWQLIFSFVCIFLAAFVLAKISSGEFSHKSQRTFPFAILFLLLTPFFFNFSSASSSAIDVANLLSRSSGFQIAFLMLVALLCSVNLSFQRRRNLVVCLITVTVFLEGYFLAQSAAWFNAPALATNKHSDGVQKQVKDILASSEHSRLLSLSGWQSRNLNPDLSRTNKIPSVNWYGPLLNSRASEILGSTSGGWTRPAILSSENQVLDIYGVSLVEPYWPESTPVGFGESGSYPSDRFTKIATTNEVGLYQNKRALPRFRFVFEGRNVTDEEALKALRTSKFSDGTKFLAPETVLLPQNAPAFYTKSSTEIKVLNNKLSSFEMSIELEEPSGAAAMLVVGDNYSSNWRAEINGREIIPLRVNYNQLGVFIPVNTQKINIKYSDKLRTFGFIISLLALVSLFTFVFVWVRRSKSSQLTLNILKPKLI